MNMVGYNLVDAKEMFDSIRKSCVESRNSIVCIKEIFDSTLFVYSYKDPLNDKGWFSPEAVEFERNVLRPIITSLIAEVEKSYARVIGDLRNAVMLWSDGTTGQRLPESVMSMVDPLRLADSEFQLARATNDNGDIFINTNVVDHLKHAYANEYRNYIDEAKTSINSAKKQVALIGNEQQEGLNIELDTLYSDIIKNTDELFKKAVSEVQKAIDKYRDIARRVSSSFNGGSVR